MQNIDGSRNKGPLSDAIIIAVAKLVDDAQSDKREPSHSDIEYQINRTQLQSGDPKAAGQIVGKAKRVRGTLMWAMQNSPEEGEFLVANLISMIKGYGGFRPESTNYCGSDCIKSAVEAFNTEGYELTTDGELIPLALQNLSGMELTKALKSYIRRAQRGIKDAALITGTGKDLLEAVAAHVLQEHYGSYVVRDNFPTLLGQAFVTMGLATSQDKPIHGEPPQKRVERAMFELGLSINQLRNKEGTGHGRPWLHSVSEYEARIAVELMGIIAERLLLAYEGEK
jgi:hypothetical protein